MDFGDVSRTLPSCRDIGCFLIGLLLFGAWTGWVLRGCMGPHPASNSQELNVRSQPFTGNEKENGQ